MSDKQRYLKFYFAYVMTKSARSNQKQQYCNENCTFLNSANIQYLNSRNYNLQINLFIKRLFFFLFLK